MSKRLQVLMTENEYAQLKRRARKNKQSVGSFVREVLRNSKLGEEETSTSDKLKSIEKSAKYEFPVSDLDTMLQEIEAGYTEEQIDNDRFESSHVSNRKRASFKKPGR
jgi:hypothetical protein